MGKIESIINDLEQNADEMAVQAAIAYLKSLKPSGNEDLLAKLNKCRDDYTTSEVPSEILHALDKAISALSSPVPFDVLGHLRDGGKITDSKGDSFWSLRHDELAAHKVDDMTYIGCCTIGSLIASTDWQPYTQSERELEDGWYWVKHSERPDLTDEPFIAKLYSYSGGQNKRWESRYADVPFSSCVPITNPTTGKPWRIEEPKND